MAKRNIHDNLKFSRTLIRKKIGMYIYEAESRAKRSLAKRQRAEDSGLHGKLGAPGGYALGKRFSEWRQTSWKLQGAVTWEGGVALGG